MNTLVNAVIDKVFAMRTKEINNYNFLAYKSPFKKSITDNENVYCALVIGLVENQNNEKEVVTDLLTPKREYQLVAGDIIELNFFGQKAIYIVRKNEVLSVELLGTFRGSKEEYYDYLKTIPEMSEKIICH